MIPQAVAVLGMHRSGTSCLAGILQAAGLPLGEVVTAAPFNKKGNRENLRIRALNDSLLSESGGAWDRPLVVTSWSRELETERAALVADFTTELGERWGFKDPRTVLTWRFWREAVDLTFVATIRHPLLVAMSLQSRNGFTLEQGVEIWRCYNQEILNLHQASPFPIIRFDTEAEAYAAEALKICAALQLPGYGMDFFDKGLIHSTEADDAALSPAARSLWYSLLDRI